MPYLLRNEFMELRIDHPLENYKHSRFDWTGKIVQLTYKGVSFCTTEFADARKKHESGRGFFNEFGMDTALGFSEAEMGGWFHKIGVGLLKKDTDSYDFLKPYEVQPASFDIKEEDQALTLVCEAALHLGYAYTLEKRIALKEDGFAIHYQLVNTGNKTISSEEYTHNFIAIQNTSMGSDYQLTLPFIMDPTAFDQNLNKEGACCFEANKVRWTDTPENPIFFSNLSGKKSSQSRWELRNKKAGLSISESTNFMTDKVNLWGWSHVASPELFFKFSCLPGQSVAWQRRYKVGVLTK